MSSDYRLQIELLERARAAYGVDFPSERQAGLTILAAVQQLLDRDAAAAIATRWEHQFAIDEAHAEHRAQVRSIMERTWVTGDDGPNRASAVRTALAEVDENWRRDPIGMLRMTRRVKELTRARAELFFQFPDRKPEHDAIRKRFLTERAESVQAELDRFDDLWLGRIG